MKQSTANSSRRGNPTHIEEEEEEEENKVYTQTHLNVEDFINDDDFQLPQYEPISFHSLPLGTHSVRKLVIEKQNSRVFPTNNRLLDKMEDALVRWKPPQSSFQGSTAVLRGKHPYQLEEDSIKISLHESLNTVKQCFDGLVQAVHKDSIDLSNTNSTSSFIVDEVRASIGNDASSKTHTSAKTLKAVPFGEDVHDLEACVTEKKQEAEQHYTLPIPSYYLINPRNNLVLTNNATTSQDQQGCWDLWCEFWQDVWTDILRICTCNYDDEDGDEDVGNDTYLASRNITI